MAEQPAMTVGDLARRTGVSVKVLRRQQDLGLIYTRGRSPAGYRLFDENALWCVRIVRALRDLGLTEAEIQQLAETCDTNPGLVGPPLAALLQRSRARIDARIHELEQQRHRIDTFAHRYREALTGHGACGTPDPWGPDPAESSGAA